MLQYYMMWVSLCFFFLLLKSRLGLLVEIIKITLSLVLTIYLTIAVICDGVLLYTYAYIIWSYDSLKGTFKSNDQSSLQDSDITLHSKFLYTLQHNTNDVVHVKLLGTNFFLLGRKFYVIREECYVGMQNRFKDDILDKTNTLFLLFKPGSSCSGSNNSPSFLNRVSCFKKTC